MAKHIAIARRTCGMLDSLRARRTVEDERQSAAVEAWLVNLESQVRRTVPRARKALMPTASEIVTFVEGVVQRTMREINMPGSHNDIWVARECQRACIAMLVTGSHVPPCR